MKGTLVNSGAIIAGSIVGIMAGKRLPDRIRTAVMHALGLAVLAVGLQMTLSGKDFLLVIGSLLAGAVAGEFARIEDRIGAVGGFLKRRFRSDSSTFVEGFVTSSVLYITGAMVIVGSIQEGTTGNAEILYTKSILDGVASVAFASTYGIGVAFSALSVFAVQGSITLLSSSLGFLQSPNVLEAVTATGGVLITAIGLNLLGVVKIRVGNLVPALVFAIIWALIK
jgi:uncharacterized membrane protein YqgA involved in biofilm formation